MITAFYRFILFILSTYLMWYRFNQTKLNGLLICIRYLLLGTKKQTESSYDTLAPSRLTPKTVHQQPMVAPLCGPRLHWGPRASHPALCSLPSRLQA